MADYSAPSTLIDLRSHNSNFPWACIVFKRKRNAAGFDYYYTTEINVTRHVYIQTVLKTISIRSDVTKEQIGKSIALRMGSRDIFRYI